MEVVVQINRQQRPAKGTRLLECLAAAFCYAVATAILFRNLLPVAATRLYSDLGDPLLNSAVLAWNASNVILSREWWNFPSFAPLSGVTAFTEHLIGAYPIATPIIWLTGNPVLAHNVLLLVCFPLNGVAAYALVREVTRSATGGFIGGLAFAFAPYHAEHLSHIQALMAFGMPFALVGLHRYTQTGTTAALGWFAFGWLSVLLSSAYMLVFFPILVAFWSIWFLRGVNPRRLVSIGSVTVLATLPVLPLLWGYHIRQSAYGFLRDYEEIKNMSADITALFDISHRAVLWKSWLSPTSFENGLFPGFAIIALAVVGIVAHLRQKVPSNAWAPRLFRCAAACGVVVLARIWAGPWGWHFGPIPFPPFRPYELGMFTVVIFLIGIVVTSRFRAAWSRHDAVVFYGAATVAMWLFALGPEPAWSGTRVLTHGPYSVLLQIPGAQSIRVPARAWLPAALCLAVCAGAGASHLIRASRRWWLIVPFAIGIVAEGSFYDGTMRAPMAILKGVIPSGSLVLDLPLTDGYMNADPQYLAVLSNYRVVNGYSGYTPPHFDRLRHALADHPSVAFDSLRRLADLYVIARPAVDVPFIKWLESQDGAALLEDTAGWKVYRLPRSGAEPLPPMPLPLPRAGRPAF